MTPLDLLTFITFCSLLSTEIDLPAGLYLQCRHAGYEMIESFDNVESFNDWYYENLPEVQPKVIYLVDEYMKYNK